MVVYGPGQVAHSLVERVCCLAGLVPRGLGPLPGDPSSSMVPGGGLRRVCPGEQALDRPDKEDHGRELHVPRAGCSRPFPRDGLDHPLCPSAQPPSPRCSLQFKCSLCLWALLWNLFSCTQISDFVAFVNHSANYALQRLSRLITWATAPPLEFPELVAGTLGSLVQG